MLTFYSIFTMNFSLKNTKIVKWFKNRSKMEINAEKNYLCTFFIKFDTCKNMLKPNWVPMNFQIFVILNQPNAVNVSDGKLDFAAHFLLINGHFDNFEWESFMEKSIYAGTTRQFIGGDQPRGGAFNWPFHVRGELLDHSVWKREIKCIIKLNFFNILVLFIKLFKSILLNFQKKIIWPGQDSNFRLPNNDPILFANRPTFF